MNLVTAEPMPGEIELLEEFCAGLQPPVLGQLVKAVFHQMELAGEAGALLKIEEELQDAIEAAKKQWLAGPKPEQLALWPELEQPQAEQLRFDLSGISGEQFWEQAEELVLAALRDYAEQVANGQGLARRLFAEDTVQGFAFIDLCRQQFSLVLMNPPFGVATQNTKAYYNKNYPNWNNNLLCCFIDRMISITEANGKVGAIYDKSAWVKLTFEEFRQKVLLAKGAFGASVDLGWEVLDANVEVVANVIDIPPLTGSETGTFFDLQSIVPESKGAYLQSCITEESADNPLYLTTNSELRHLPNAVIAYDILPFVRRSFLLNPSFMSSGFKGYVGAQVRVEQHFFLFWERPQIESLGPQENYCHLYNGGENLRFYVLPRDIALFGPNGSNVNQSDKSFTWRLRLTSTGKHYFRLGIGFGKRGHYLDAHFLRVGHLFSTEGQFMPIDDIDDVWLILGLLNSSVYQVIINTFCGQHKTTGYINLLPFPKMGSPPILC